MPLNLSGQIRETFRKAALQNEAAHGLTADDWGRYREIETGYEKRTRLEYREYMSGYATRVELARKQLMNEAGKKNLTLTHRIFGRDGFDKEAIDRQAQRIVRADHEAALLKLEADKKAQLDALFRRAKKRGELENKFKQDFENAADRRSGQDRRHGPQR